MNSHRFTHEIQHGIQHSAQRVQITPLVDQEASLSLAATDQSSDSINVIEHQLLHAVDHLEIFLEVFPKQYFLSEANLALFFFSPTIIAATMADAPFRPPRLNLLSLFSST